MSAINTRGSNALTSAEPNPIIEPLKVVHGPGDRIHVQVPASRKPTGPPSIECLKEQILLEKEIYRAREIAVYRRRQPDSSESDDALWAQIQADEKFACSDCKVSLSYEEPWVAEALKRCNIFTIEEESGYPLIPDEALLSPDLPEDIDLSGGEAYDSNLIGEYLRVVEPVTDAPRAFHLATLLSVVGAAAGRRSYFIGAGSRQYLNTWILLAGPSASGKSTAAGYGLKLFDGISKHLSDRNLAINRNIGSIQALMLFMNVARPGSRSRVVLNYEDEVLDLVAKSKKDATLLTQLLTSYGCPEELENNTLKSHIVVKDPCLSMLACGVDKILPNKFSKEDTESGFLNRWCIFLSRKTRKLAISPFLNEERLFLITKLLAQRLHETEGEITLSDGARKLFTGWYDNLDDQTDGLLARTTGLSRKYACIYAILEGAKEVQVCHMRAGMTLALYNYECVRRMTATSGHTESRKAEDATLRAIVREGGTDVRHLAVYRITGQGSQASFAIAQALAAEGSIKIEHGSKSNQIRLTITDQGRKRLPA